MIEIEKMRALTTESPCNLNIHQIIEISLVLRSTYMILRDQDKFVFYVKNYINRDYFNQLFNPDSMKKGIRNADPLVRKLGPALTMKGN